MFCVHIVWRDKSDGKNLGTFSIKFWKEKRNQEKMEACSHGCHSSNFKSFIFPSFSNYTKPWLSSRAIFLKKNS